MMKTPFRRIINAVAPIRICDLGGWTDTWFAEHGTIFNIGVYPYAEVQVKVFEEGEAGIVLHAENYGERYAVPAPPSSWGPHPLLEAAIPKIPAAHRLAAYRALTRYRATPRTAQGCSR